MQLWIENGILHMDMCVKIFDEKFVMLLAIGRLKVASQVIYIPCSVLKCGAYGCICACIRVRGS